MGASQNSGVVGHWVQTLPLCPICLENTRRVTAIAVIAMAASLAGCATQSQLEVADVREFAGPMPISVQPCIDRTGTSTRDVAADATKAFAARLSGTTEFNVVAGARYGLMCEVTGFVEGSAVKRWIMPGWGATSCQVAAMVTDTETGRTVFSGRATADVSGGGLYTIGAESYIVDAAVADLVSQMQKALFARAAAGAPRKSQ